jgi:hypothetical protein
MKRRLVAALVLVAAIVAPLRADLKYTMKIEARPSTVPAEAPANPLFAMVGGFVLGMIAPPGGVEMTTTVGTNGARIEYSKAYTVVPAGGALLVSPDGSITVIDPATKTYWKTTKAESSAAMANISAQVDIKATGTSATVAGVQAQRSTISIKVPLPMGAGMQMPGMPTDLAVSGEVWLTDKYKNYSPMTAGIAGGLNALGFDKLSAAGFPMRTIMRSDLFAGQEIESVVTSLSEVTAPASTYQVPAGYKEVQPQMGGPMGGPMGGMMGGMGGGVR